MRKNSILIIFLAILMANFYYFESKEREGVVSFHQRFAPKRDQVSKRSSAIKKKIENLVKKPVDERELFEDKLSPSKESVQIEEDKKPKLEEPQFDISFMDPWLNYMREQLLDEGRIKREDMDKYLVIAGEFNRETSDLLTPEAQKDEEEQLVINHKTNLEYYKILDKYHDKLIKKIGEKAYSEIESARNRFNRASAQRALDGEPFLMISL